MASAELPADVPTASDSEAALAALGDAVQAALGDVPIEATIPDDSTRAVVLMPLGLTRLGRIQQGDTIIELRLRVLVVTVGPNPLADLETLLVGFDHYPRLEVERDEPPLELWSLLAVRPRPSAIIRLDVPVTIPAAPVPLVLTPMHLDTRVVRTVEGILVGPGNVALPFGRVRAAEYDREVPADRDGRFRLAVPVDDDHLALTVDVKGMTFTADVPLRQAGPILVHCDREES